MYEVVGKDRVVVFQREVEKENCRDFLLVLFFPLVPFSTRSLHKSFFNVLDAKSCLLCC